MNAMPRFVVLGGPVPEGLPEALAGQIELLTEGEIAETEADGVILWASGDVIPALRRFRDNGGLLPIFGWSEEPVDVPSRLRWVREGGDDLLDPAFAADALIDRVRGPGRKLVAESDLGLRVDRWLLALARYLGAREDLVAALGESGRQQYVDVTFLRDQVLRATEGDAPPDAFGQRRGSDRESFSWPMRLVEPEPADAELRNIGPEGLRMALPVAPMTGAQVLLQLEGLTVAALLAVEVRWQRRTARDRWEAGGFALGCRITRGG
ncbi:MAG: hypothetical protein ACOZNI_02265 [Myxococcota bacterium]